MLKLIDEFVADEILVLLSGVQHYEVQIQDMKDNSGIKNAGYITSLPS